MVSCRRQNVNILECTKPYSHTALGMSLTDVLNNSQRKMGHAFVLMMLLEQDVALTQIKLRQLTAPQENNDATPAA